MNQRASSTSTACHIGPTIKRSIYMARSYCIENEYWFLIEKKFLKFMDLSGPHIICIAPSPHWSLCAGYTRRCPRPGHTHVPSVQVQCPHMSQSPGTRPNVSRQWHARAGNTCWCDLTPEPWTACTRSTGGDGQGPGPKTGKRTPSRASRTWASDTNTTRVTTSCLGGMQTRAGCTGPWATSPTQTTQWSTCGRSKSRGSTRIRGSGSHQRRGWTNFHPNCDVCDLCQNMDLCK